MTKKEQGFWFTYERLLKERNLDKEDPDHEHECHRAWLDAQDLSDQSWDDYCNRKYEEEAGK